MYTAYIVFTTILVVSFITGIILTIVEHEQKKNKRIVIDKDVI